MGTQIVTPVDNNMEKFHTYRTLKGRYAKAVQYGFYFEALLIDYALLEDRLRSFLYHAGALSNRKATNVSAKRTKVQIKDIVTTYKGERENDSLGIKRISDKMKIVRSIVCWINDAEDIGEDKYLKTLKYQGESMDIGGLLEALGNMASWCNYRNEVIHAALNKNIESLYSDLDERVKEGMELANFLDSQVRIIKKGNKIRKSANLVIEK